MPSKNLATNFFPLTNIHRYAAYAAEAAGAAGAAGFAQLLCRAAKKAIPKGGGNVTSAATVGFSRRLNRNPDVAPVRFFTVENTIKSNHPVTGWTDKADGASSGAASTANGPAQQQPNRRRNG